MESIRIAHSVCGYRIRTFTERAVYEERGKINFILNVYLTVKTSEIQLIFSWF